MLHVVAYDTGGQASDPAMVRVRVVEPVVIADITATATLAPSLTPTVGATPTEMPRPPLQMNVWVDRPDLRPGECTVLHWEVGQATRVLLDGQAIADAGTRHICPTASTFYRFRAEGLEGVIERTVMVSLSSPPEASPPAITGVSASVAELYKPNCQPNTVTITANVSDASGVSRVELVYRVVEGSRVGQWQTLTMTPAGGQRYQVTFGWEQLRLSRDPPVQNRATIECYIRAADTGGHQGQSGMFPPPLANCLI